MLDLNSSPNLKIRLSQLTYPFICLKILIRVSCMKELVDICLKK